MNKAVKTIAIAGAGTMGAGIAQVTAQAGYDTILFDISGDVLAKAKAGLEKSLRSLTEKGRLPEGRQEEILGRMRFTERVEDLKCDLLIEAIVEKLEVKRQFFQQVAALNPSDTILATNTSSIPVTRIAAGIPHPERVVGIHFFNPAPVMKLVEIISGVETNPEVAAICRKVIEGLGKTVVMAADAPGFIVNRVARHYYVEALRLVDEGVADLNTVDELMEASGFRMGPFRLMDLIGVDTNFSVTSSIYNLFHQEGKFRPSRLQQQKVDAGHWGKKTGKGFYNYE